MRFHSAHATTVAPNCYVVQHGQCNSEKLTQCPEYPLNKQTNKHNYQIREGFELNCGWVGVKSLKILVRIQCHVYMAYLTILSILFVHVSDQFPEICGRFRTFWKVVGVGGWGDNLHTSEHTLDVLLFFSNLSSLILFFRQQTNMETEKPLSFPSCG